MEITILGSKEFKSKKDKTIYMVNVAYEKDGVNGLEVDSLFTTEAHYPNLCAMVGHKVDTKTDVALFFDKSAIYCRKADK